MTIFEAIPDIIISFSAVQAMICMSPAMGNEYLAVEQGEIFDGKNCWLIVFSKYVF